MIQDYLTKDTNVTDLLLIETVLKPRLTIAQPSLKTGTKK